MRIKFLLLSGLVVCLTVLAACVPFQTADSDKGGESIQSEAVSPENHEVPETILDPGELALLLNPVSLPPGALSPEALVYRGAFRLPNDSGGMGWDYSGHGMTYYPDGDLGGEVDGFPGSLFIVGHDQELYVGEVSIPEPVISRNLENLNTAQTLQALTDISGGNVTDNLVLPRMGIEYLPPMGDLSEGKLHFAIGQHIQGFEPSHGWTSTDLRAPNTSGLWVFDGFTNYTSNDYLFEIPEDWAAAHLPGFRLASGRFREGVWGGLGPALYACAPWLDGSPPSEGQKLQHVLPLLLYGKQVEQLPELDIQNVQSMRVYSESDHWWGGAWLTAPGGSSVIFTGTKAVGKSWYGFANGVVWDVTCTEDPSIPCPEIPAYPYDNRGYWAQGYLPAILFYDPEDLAQVARGEMASDAPQPYALMDLSDYWFDPEINVEIYKRDLVGAAAFDRRHCLLYIVERLGDGAQSLIHVFQIMVE